jgi:hypothetical protein
MAVFGAVAATSSTPSPADILVAQVFAALNEMRADPRGHIADMRVYRDHLNGRLVRMPGTKVTYLTLEGRKPVDEAALFLGAVQRRSILEQDSVLQAAAADHVAAQGISGATGHYDVDGAGPGARVARRGGGAAVTEVIAYGAFDAADVIRQLVVDDGVPGRGHRRAIFAGNLRYAGVACGPHPKFRTMCVIDMAATPAGGTPRFLDRPKLASAG